MSNNSLINKYKNLNNIIMLYYLKKQISKKENNNRCQIDLLRDRIGVYNGFIGMDVDVVVGGNFKNSDTFKTGNLDEAYLSLINKIGTKFPINISSEQELIDILNKVYTTVIEYFGFGDIEARNKHYVLYGYSGNTTLESLKGKNLAVCLEDAVLSQNMLKLLGFDSILKVSLVQYNDGQYDTHAYNLIKFRNNYYIFDSRFPSKSNPVVSVLTEEDYLKFVSDLDSDAEVVNADNGIIYYAANIPLKQIKKEGNKVK